MIVTEQTQRPQKRNLHLKERADTSGRILVRYYTDPICCWSWTFEKSWRRLLDEYADKITFKYVLCGMMRDWASYRDPMNDISNPAQMGPLWMHASEVTGVYINTDIWHRDPPASSYPACLAVKTAGLQSTEAEHEYLSLLRKAVMHDGRNISRHEVLVELGEKLTDCCEFDFAQFKTDLSEGNGKQLFLQDMQLARFHGIGRYPTLTFTKADGGGLMIVGHRPFEALETAFLKAASL